MSQQHLQDLRGDAAETLDEQQLIRNLCGDEVSTLAAPTWGKIVTKFLAQIHGCLWSWMAFTNLRQIGPPCRNDIRAMRVVIRGGRPSRNAARPREPNRQCLVYSAGWQEPLQTTVTTLSMRLLRWQVTAVEGPDDQHKASCLDRRPGCRGRESDNCLAPASFFHRSE